MMDQSGMAGLLQLLHRYRATGVEPPMRIPIQNPDGSVSTQQLATFNDNGGYFNVPTLWSGEQLHPLDALARAISLEQQTPYRFQRFPDEHAAISSAQDESMRLGALLQAIGAMSPHFDLRPPKTNMPADLSGGIDWP